MNDTDFNSLKVGDEVTVVYTKTSDDRGSHYFKAGIVEGLNLSSNALSARAATVTKRAPREPKAGDQYTHPMRQGVVTIVFIDGKTVLLDSSATRTAVDRIVWDMDKQRKWL